MAPVTKRTTRSSQKKPYEQPPSAAKGKGKAKAATDLGAPATLSQSSRKGKKAWRKNVDVREEEEALEEARAEERQTGGRIENQSNEQLFVVDSAGDEKVAQRMRKQHPPRRSLQILTERSAVPSLTSKVVTSSAPAKKQKLNAADKERLLRIARKKVVGSDGFGAGSAVISAGPAARGENLRDVWSEVDFVPEPAEGEWGREGRPAPKPKAPKALARQRQLLLKHTEKALPVPHEGMSYNPKLESHQELLDNAVREELARLKKEEEEAKMVQAVSGFILQPQFVPGVAPGMKVADGDETAMENEDEDGDVENSVAVVTKGQKRKTQRDRNKAQRAREARRIAILKESSKRLKQSLAVLPSINEAVAAELAAKEKAAAARAAARLARERKGLAGGEKIGKYKVKAGNVDVQLEEDLSENLRQLKPEGNLFRDRFLSLQQRALVEPRVPQLPSKRTHRIKEYEKHAWKRFE